MIINRKVGLCRNTRAIKIQNGGNICMIDLILPEFVNEENLENKSILVNGR